MRAGALTAFRDCHKFRTCTNSCRLKHQYWPRYFLRQLLRLLKSGKRPPAIVFGPPETERFDGNEHYNYVQDIFGALGECDPENLDDLADSLNMLIDEDDSHRPEWHLLCKLSEEKFMALQLAALF